MQCSMQVVFMDPAWTALVQRAESLSRAFFRPSLVPGFARLSPISIPEIESALSVLCQYFHVDDDIPSIMLTHSRTALRLPASRTLVRGVSAWANVPAG